MSRPFVYDTIAGHCDNQQRLYDDLLVGAESVYILRYDFYYLTIKIGGRMPKYQKQIFPNLAGAKKSRERLLRDYGIQAEIIELRGDQACRLDV